MIFQYVKMYCKFFDVIDHLKCISETSKYLKYQVKLIWKRCKLIFFIILTVLSNNTNLIFVVS